MIDLDETRRVLQEGSPTDKATRLWSLAVAVDVPDDVMLLIANLMEDRSPARMYIPFRYGEVRYIAAETYAKLQFEKGRTEPVLLMQTIAPIGGDRLEAIRKGAGLPQARIDALAWFAELRERGLLEVIDEVFDLEYFNVD